MNMITGPMFQTMVVEGALAIAEKKEQANELNVFPVPDGDTGTNMSLTMASAMEEMGRLSRHLRRPQIKLLLRCCVVRAEILVLSCHCCFVAWQKNCGKSRRRTAVISPWRCGRA